MKVFWIAALALLLVQRTTAFGETAEITIDQIEANDHVSGSIHGLAHPAEYKVLVYVHTDQWYIHPYAGQGEGQSWAPITDSGAWHIRTVQRQFKADKIAAVVVKRNYSEPDKTEGVDAIPHDAIVIEELKGTADYGKL
jgi:hypothetical protein